MAELSNTGKDHVWVFEVNKRTSVEARQGETQAGVISHICLLAWGRRTLEITSRPLGAKAGRAYPGIGGQQPAGRTHTPGILSQSSTCATQVQPQS